MTGEEVAGQEGATLVQIGAVQRTSANSPHLGQIVVNGLIEAQEVQAAGSTRTTTSFIASRWRR